MQKLCFGTLITILGYCAAPRALDRTICGKLLLTVNEDYDICTDSTTTSKLKNGYGNLSALITEKITEINPCDLAIRIKESLLPLLDSRKYTKVIATLLMVIEEDGKIYNDAIVDKMHHLTKMELLTKKEFVFEELLAGLLVYIALYTDNMGSNEYVKKISSEYVELAYRKRNDIKIVDRRENDFFAFGKERVEDMTTLIKEEDKKVLKIAALIGSWHDDFEGDKTTPKNFFKIEADEFFDSIKKDLRIYDGILIYKDKNWSFNNHKDILLLFPDLIFDEDIDVLFKLANEIFLESNFKYDLPSDKRYFTNVLNKGKQLIFSDSLKKGVMESIAIICNAENRFTNCSYHKIKNAIYSYERKLFANRDWKFYASIADYMNELAEACPNAFLERLQDMLECKDEEFLKFLHEKENFIVEKNMPISYPWLCVILPYQNVILRGRCLYLSNWRNIKICF